MSMNSLGLVLGAKYNMQACHNPAIIAFLIVSINLIEVFHNRINFVINLKF